MIAPGSTLVGFTDGLVERRGEDLDDGLERLRAAVEAAPVEATADQLCEHLVARLAGSEDDAAVLVVRLL